jgi:hypothetical protein
MIAAKFFIFTLEASRIAPTYGNKVFKYATDLYPLVRALISSQNLEVL